MIKEVLKKKGGKKKITAIKGGGNDSERKNKVTNRKRGETGKGGNGEQK